MLTYLALGDSYTIGEQVPYTDNFPNKTANILRQQNVAIADPVIIATTGWTTDELQTAIREKALNETFSFVSLLIGVNNQYRGRSVENYQEEFTQLLQQAIHFANGHSDKVFVLSIPDWGATAFAEGKDRIEISNAIDAYNSAAEKIAKSYKCPYINITESTRSNAANELYMAADGLHPSAKEYAIWGEMLANEIMKRIKA